MKETKIKNDSVFVPVLVGSITGIMLGYDQYMIGALFFIVSMFIYGLSINFGLNEY